MITDNQLHNSIAVDTWDHASVSTNARPADRQNVRTHAWATLYMNIGKPKGLASDVTKRDAVDATRLIN